MGESGFASRTHVTPNFVINYQTEGPAVVENDLSDFNVMEPGSNPPRVMTTLPGGTVPAYVRLVAFWLERSLQSYTSAPFSMRNPAANGRLSAVINSAPFGGANTDAFYINNALPAELVCAVAVHELFHMVQFSYEGQGDWLHGMDGRRRHIRRRYRGRPDEPLSRRSREQLQRHRAIGRKSEPVAVRTSGALQVFAVLALPCGAKIATGRRADDRRRHVPASYRRMLGQRVHDRFSQARDPRPAVRQRALHVLLYDAGMADTPASTETIFRQLRAGLLPQGFGG